MPGVEWVEKYRPKTLAEIVGNPKALQELKAWAEAFEAGRAEKRAVILAGEAGVGKTSAAYALARDMGWEVLELNASDQRNYEQVRRIAKQGAVHDTFSPSGEFLPAAKGRRTLVLLDEADNLFGNQDRGGMKAILETVREAGQPVLLIANDLYALTRGAAALKGLCATIKFQRARKDQIAALLRKIAAAEGVRATPEALAAIAERAGGDLRSAINDLQALAEGRTELSPGDVEALGYRDARASIFDAVATILKTQSAETARRVAMELDESPDTLLLWLDENLPQEYEHPADLVEGMTALSRADIYLGRAMRRQQFRLWRYATDLLTAGVALAKQKPYAGYRRYQFPSWLRVMSGSRGSRQVRDSVARKLGRHTHLGTGAARQEQLPAVRALGADDPDFALWLARTLELEEAELSFLWGEKSAVTKKVLQVLEAREVELPVEHAEDPPEEPGDAPGAASGPGGKGRQAGLGDF